MLLKVRGLIGPYLSREYCIPLGCVGSIARVALLGCASEGFTEYACGLFFERDDVGTDFWSRILGDRRHGYMTLEDALLGKAEVSVALNPWLGHHCPDLPRWNLCCQWSFFGSLMSCCLPHLRIAASTLFFILLLRIEGF